MKKAIIILSAGLVFLLGLSLNSNPVLIKNNTAFNLQFVFTTADQVPSNYKDYKIDLGKLFGKHLGYASGYFEIAPNQSDAILFGLTKPISMKQSTSVSWKNLNDLGSPPFSEQIENQAAAHPNEAPLLVIGTKNLGLSWDIQLKWVSQTEGEKIFREGHYSKFKIFDSK